MNMKNIKYYKEDYKLSNVIKVFDKNNLKRYGIDSITNKYKNIIFDTVKNKNNTYEIIYHNVSFKLNLSTCVCKLIKNCICYYCSGVNKEKKVIFKIYKILSDLNIIFILIIVVK